MDATRPAAGPAGRERGRSGVRIVVALIVVVLIGVIAGGAWALGAFAADDPPGAIVPRRDPLLPDLAMGPIQDIAIGTTDTGQQRLRFAAMIVNVGAGPFVIRARRTWPWSDDWTVDQWLAERSGGYSVSPTGASLVYGGDGHNHWHVKQVEVHQLETLDGKVLGRLVKQGFCFFDTDGYKLGLTGAPSDAHWGSIGCGSNLSTRVHMGLSVGWGDKYPWFLIDERIDVTKVPDGKYRLREIADPNHEFQEASTANNETWVVIELSTQPGGLRAVKVVQTGPTP